jgi:hypothetical protein
MLNAGVAGFGRRVLGEAKDIAATDAGQPARPGDSRKRNVRMLRRT